MSILNRAVVGWGIMSGASSADQLANLSASWGLVSSAPQPPKTIGGYIRKYITVLSMWLQGGGTY